MGTTDNNFWIKIQQGLRETEILMNQQQYNLSMIKARQTVEYMVNYLGEKALIVEGDLADSIDQLFEGRLISQTSKDHYHRIRMIGNKAVHEGSDSPYDAGEALKLLAGEVNAFANTFHRESPEDATYKQRQAPLRPVAIAPNDRSQRSSSQKSNSQKSNSQKSSSQRDSSQRNNAQRDNAQRGNAQRSGSHRGNAPQGQAHRPQSGNKAASSGQAPRSASKGRSRRRSRQSAPETNGLLKPALIFLGILVLVLIFIKLVPGKGGKQNPAPTETSTQISTEVPTTSETPEETTEAETEAPITYTTKSKLNVRSKPSTDGTRLGSLAADTKVEFVKTYDDKWSVIMFEGKEAYIATEFLTKSEGASDSTTKETTASSEPTKKAGQ
ncbi:SH3 domain-containing protein [Lacrimispora algidixylanolytica]|uniref:Ligand-binding protein SH3 n=1 Tax=Lacrimispora algidixylanolytica TaxID=94868 RepID=A0A419TCW3_9FIRM|nr:SH3 domain-containing protein [Lacrimispora algidixylanolytica]RKD35308.1 ligand-binding protein SH3 [Lacrimispora algidixylanolytica]